MGPNYDWKKGKPVERLVTTASPQHLGQGSLLLVTFRASTNQLQGPWGRNVNIYCIFYLSAKSVFWVTKAEKQAGRH